MPDKKSDQVPDAAIDKFILELFGFHKERLIGEAGDEDQRREVRRMLKHVAPVLEQAAVERVKKALEAEQERLEAQAEGESRLDNVNLSMAHAEGIALLLDHFDFTQPQGQERDRG